MRIDVDKWVDGQNGSHYFHKWNDVNQRIMERIGKPTWREEFYSNGLVDAWNFKIDMTSYELALTTDGQIKVILPNEIKEKIEEIYKAFEEEGVTQ